MASRWLPVVPAGAAICLALAGCATVPSGGAPRAVKGASTQVQAYVLPEPPPLPTSRWSPEDTLIAFLHASATYLIDPAAARAYLAPDVVWNPSAITVVGAPRKSEFVEVRKAYRVALPNAPAGTEYSAYSYSGQKIATLSQSGQYLYAPGNNAYKFRLAKINGVWLIDKLPQVRLLTEADFKQVYRPLNLYFFSKLSSPNSAGPFLVPDPVYAPVEGTDTALNTTVASNLVKGLFKDSKSWLSDATTTSFPAGTVLKSLSITNQTATVDLTTPGRLSSSQEIDMADQIVWTLTTSSGYSSPVAHSVIVKVNGRVPYTGGLSKDQVPGVNYNGGPEAIYFQNGQGGVDELAPGYKSPKAVPSPGDLNEADITALAARPTGASRLAVAVRRDNGCAVYISRPAGQSGPYQLYPLATSGGPCLSLSWDSSGYLWAATAHSIWLLKPGKHPQAISPPSMPGTNGADYQILALRMAPDAVRAALLVQAPKSPPSILLAAVSHSGNSASFGPAVTAGTGLTDALSLAWYNPYYLAVLADSSVYQVPLTGGPGQSLGSAPPGATSLTTNGTDFAVGSSDEIQMSPASTISWERPISGINPIYPG